MHAAGAPPVTVWPAKWEGISAPRVSRRYLSIRFRTSFYSQSENHHYSRRSQQYWDKFYKLHKNKFSFSLDPVYTGSCSAPGCSFIFPGPYVHACDFSAKAVTLVKSHANYSSEKINVFVCDAANDDLCANVVPFTVDVVTLIFTLSAVSPCKMASVLENCKQVLKPNGHILLRDYAVGDSAQVKLHDRNQMISENFYFRGDGTCSFYFSETYTSTLFQSAGFAIVDINTYCKEITNHSRNITMQRAAIIDEACKPGRIYLTS
ncbi:hypothetical protein KY290_019306 [Solanum tuberosum]|uniref:Methyltransferase type 12 domain-containing protein n=1 Tax=Solanum tuberosum TaxID=4113 RepID=A0ABQ7VGN2_SOLTU|nr:hypothetical protein KY284_018256 [Solanum tuberosum]KAH0763233.1 hypothetical protein KY290_019306 [Solanum tuberosum]